MSNILFAVLLGAVLSPVAPGQATRPVARVGDVEIPWEDLDRTVGDRDLKARTEEYSARVFALAKLIDDAVLADEAKKRGVSVDDLLRTAVASKVQSVSPDEARVAYEATHPHARTAPTDEDLAILAETLKTRRAAMARGDYIRELRRQRSIEIFLSPPRASRAVQSVGPSLGKADAPVTIVEFSDFQCPYCAHGEKTMAQLRAAYGDKLRFVFRNFPMAMHPKAQAAAEAAMCADRQGRFWEMHDRIFGDPSALANSDLLKYASELGLDESAFQRCIADHETAEAVSKDKLAAWDLDIAGTPAYLVNGKLIPGATTLEQFNVLIDEELRSAAGKEAGR